MKVISEVSRIDVAAKAVIIKRLKEHLRYSGQTEKNKKCYALRYLMDFLLCSYSVALQIYENEVL